jgi:hypothetical protein
MNRYTLWSKMPHTTLRLLCVAMLAMLAGSIYTLWLDPEVRLWKASYARKLDWVSRMHDEHGYAIGVIGGSTTTFGIDAEFIHQAHRLPVANLGLHAGMGPSGCIGFGFKSLKAGDTLLLSLEPSMLYGEVGHDAALASKFAMSLGNTEILDWTSKPSVVTRLRRLTSLRPGGYHLLTMMGKLALGLPHYRYSIDQLRPGGLQVTDERRTFADSMTFDIDRHQIALSAYGRELLTEAAKQADRRGIKIAYVLPWAYWQAETAGQLRLAYAGLLDEIQSIMPVLREPAMGVHTILQDFSDSSQHLTETAARQRSESLANAIKSQHAVFAAPGLAK